MLDDCIEAIVKCYFQCAYLKSVDSVINGNGGNGNGKREMKKMGILLHNCIACPLCIQQHLERTSVTGDSGEEVEHMHDQLKYTKSIIDCPDTRVPWLRD